MVPLAPFSATEEFIYLKQECIPVGCVPSTAVAVSPATHARPAMHAPHHTCPLTCLSLAMHAAPLLTEFLTHACENITFPQLLLRTVINTTIVTGPPGALLFHRDQRSH